MITVKFDLIDPLPYRTPDYGTVIRLDAFGSVTAEQNGVGVEQQIKEAIVTGLTAIFAEYQKTVNYADIQLRTEDISRELTDRLTDMLHYPCTAKVDGIFPTEESKLMLNKLQFAKMMGNSAPAPAPVQAPAPAPAPSPAPVQAPAPAPSPSPTIPNNRPKFCGHCGTALPPTGNFCPSCGAKL